MPEKFDLAVIGAGPGGYSAAIRAAQLGAKPILIEEKKIGGTCTNVGCIPTKMLLKFIGLLSEIERNENSGLRINEVKVDLARLIQRKNEVIDNLVQGIELLLRNNNVRTIYGKGILTNEKKVEVNQKNRTKKILEVDNIIIATGSKPIKPNIPGLEGKKIFFDEDASDIVKVPSTLAIAGGGPEGVEFAYIYSRLGSEVTLLEMMPSILPREDQDIAKYLRRRMVKNGIKIENNAEVMGVEDAGNYKKIRYKLKGEIKAIETEKFLITLGRKPDIDNIGLDKVGVKTVNGRIEVNEKMETNVPNIYAIGDAVGGAYAHEAMEGGIVAAENAIKRVERGNSKMDNRVIPRCFFTIPQIAAVGLSEEEARNQYPDVSIGKFYYVANAAALIIGEDDGFVKIVADDNSKQILGVHIIGPHASELIAEAALAMKLGATYEDIVKTIHSHPTLSESLKEAAMDIEGKSIHRFKRRS